MEPRFVFAWLSPSLAKDCQSDPYILIARARQRGVARVAEILQRRPAVAPWMAPHMLRLPGTVPIAPEDWLQRDEAFAAQMAYRDRLIAERPEAVHALADSAAPAAAELLVTVLAHLDGAAGYVREGGAMRRPDGERVPLDGPPLLVAGRLAQEDFVILEKPEGAAEHVLTGAILCFPSTWTLAQKFGRTLSRIHLPVESYDAEIARRVQRLFDFIRPDQPMMRANLLLHGEAELHNPRVEFERRRPEVPRYLRVERQTFLRLPVSRAVVFGIHSYVVRPDTLPEEERDRLRALRPELFVAA